MGAGPASEGARLWDTLQEETPSLHLQLPWGPWGSLPPCFSIPSPGPHEDPDKEGKPLSLGLGGPGPKTRPPPKKGLQHDWAGQGSGLHFPEALQMDQGGGPQAGQGWAEGCTAPRRHTLSVGLRAPSPEPWGAGQLASPRHGLSSPDVLSGVLLPKAPASGCVHTTHLSHSCLLSWLHGHHWPQPAKKQRRGARV